MIPVLNPTFVIKTLLSKFSDIIYISENELQLAETYILSENPVPLVFPDSSEIYDTLVYLRDLAQESRYKSIEEVLQYFEDATTNLNELIDPLLSEKNDNRVVFDVKPIFNLAFKTDSIKMLTGVLNTNLLLAHKDYVQRLYRDLSNDCTMSGLEYTYKELNLVTHCWKRMNFLRDRSVAFNKSILPNGDMYYYKHYVESLTLPATQYPSLIFFIKQMKGWLALLRNDFAEFKTIIFKGRKKRNKMKSFYDKVFNIIQAETKVESAGFKTLLSRMMLISKMNNPMFRDYIKSRHCGYEKKKDCSNFLQSDFIWKKLYYKAFSEKNWAILKSPEGHSWITSDNPGFSIDCNLFYSNCEQLNADPFWMDVDKKSMIYFPLSGQYCLRLQPEEEKIVIQDTDNAHSVTFEVSSAEEVKFVNNLVISSKPEVIISEKKGIQLHCTEPCS